jgi:hypothetical protein
MQKQMFRQPENAASPTGLNLRDRFDDTTAAAGSLLLQQSAPKETKKPQPRPWRGAAFIDLAKSEPLRLIEVVMSGTLADHDLTFAAEALGMIEDRVTVVALLTWLSSHNSAVVREGVVYGLGRHAKDSYWARMTLERLKNSDPSPGVRRSAADAFEE